MSAAIPKCVEHSDKLHAVLEQEGLTQVHCGKVRGTYSITNPNLLLVLASDRLSIFDFVLPCTVPDKGAILTVMTVFWLRGVLADMDNHLVACGQDIDRYLPKTLQDNAELQKRSLIVKKLEMLPVEAIVRGYLTGSGWRTYQESQQICGIHLPAELHDGSQFPEPIFTPTDKAETGHDEDMDREKVRREYPGLEERALRIYGRIADYAKGKGVILADTKFEFSPRYIADEIGTPDSSRFWDWKEWEVASKQGISPSSYDKETVRNWGKEVPLPDGLCEHTKGLQHLDPENPEHVKFVHNLTVPDEVLKRTAHRYHQIFERLTDRKLDEFQQCVLGVT